MSSWFADGRRFCTFRRIDFSWLPIAGFCLLGLGTGTSASIAQEAAVTAVPTPATGTPVPANAPPPSGPPGSKPAEGPGAAPAATPGAGAPGTGEPAAAGDGKPATPAGPTLRGSDPPEPPDPQELTVRPDDDGRLSFSFRNQPWPALMVWLSEISDQPLDWQELPPDYVNLASPGRYTLDETRDLINRHLLARGFTLLRLDGGLTVAKTAGINPAVVPRVDLDQLASLLPHSFVRTSFDCGWLLAPKLAEELKPMISGNGRLVALEQTNRLDAMDAAVNLQQIAQLLAEEQSSQARADLAREFELRHIPAEEAKKMLAAFLGIEEEKAPAVMSPQQMQQMQQMQQQMAQQNGGKPPGMGEKKAEISIVVNNRRNALLVNAPPDRMAIAAQFIIQIDVPSNTLQSIADVQSRVQVFRLTSLDPTKLAEIATDMNILEPSTRLRVDEENQALIVSGSAADRFIINSLVERLDGSARQFEVLQLRRLDAQEVAESIMFLMGTEEESEDSNSRRGYMYSYYGGFGNEDKKEDKDKFRVAANVRYRQVLMWANESEMAEVRNLLVKLGEMPPEGGCARTVRLIEASSIPETYEYLQRLKEQLGAALPNEVVLPPREEFIDPISDADLTPSTIEDTDGGTGTTTKDNTVPAVKGPVPTSDRSTSTPRDHGRLVSNPVQAKGPASGESAIDESATDVPADTADEDAPQSPATDYPAVRSATEFDRAFGSVKQQDNAAPDGKPAAPIRIEVDDAGNLLLLSEDTAALDRLESMMLDVEPPKRPYTIFRVRNASATWMMLNLEDYFKDTEDTDDSSDSFFRWYYDMGPTEEKTEPGGLGKKNPMRFVADNDTGSIVVSGASTAQLKTIGELIALWDVPEPLNKRQSRFTRLVTLRHSRAEKIAETIKDAYRDLLSSNDRAFSQGNPGGGGAGTSTERGQPRSNGGGGSGLIDDSAGGKSSGDSSFTFKGKLSIGIDSVGNTLLISAEGDALLDLVCDMIRQLDTAAGPQGDIEIRTLPGTVAVGSLETALRFFVPEAEMNAPGQKPSRQNGAAPQSETAVNNNQPAENFGNRGG